MDEQQPLLPEKTRRLGVETFPIKLADGRIWGLALPRPRIRLNVLPGVDPIGRPIETIGLVTVFGYPLEIRRLIEELQRTSTQGSAELQHEALFRLAMALVQRAHEVPTEIVADLLEMELDELPAFVETVVSVVTGESLELIDLPRKSGADV